MNSQKKRVWRHTLITGVVAAVSLLGPVMTAAGDERQVSATYVFDAPDVAAAGAYSRVSMKGCAAFHRVGMPDVPFRTGRILLPSEARVESVGIELLDEVRTLDVSRPVVFARTPIPIGMTGHAAVARAAQDKPDPATYAADIPYPASRLQLVSVQKMNGYSIAIVRVFPVQYLPASGKLLFCPRLRVNVTLAATATARVSAVPLRRATEPQLQRVLSCVDNPEAVATYETTELLRAQPLTTYDYLLVTTAALTNSFQPLVQQKIADGLSVKVMTVERVLADFTGVDDAAKLRSCITYAYTNWNTSYVLLGGDTTTVPYRQAYAFCLEADATMPCDLYFACLDGSWNADGDAYWGEPADGEDGGDVDLLAEVYVGRAPVDNAAEVSNFVGKTLHYEQNTHANAGRVRILAEYLGNYDGIPAQGGDGLDRLLPAFSGHTVDWLDDRPTNAETWSAADCVAALNQSPHLVAHDGHANETYALRMGESNIDGLTNTEPFLLNSLGCYCGAFDYSDCFAEELVKRNGYGAFSVLMNSRFGWFDSVEEWAFSGEFMKCFFDSLLVQGNRNIGVANQLSKQDMIGSVETSGDMVYRWCYFEITLFGDPHTVLQLGDPLLVTPGSGLSATGPQGGPFTPPSQTYALTNADAAPVSWTATAASGLVSLSSSGGTLPPGEGTAVTVSLVPGTGDLPQGIYTDEVTFSNCVSGVSKRREISLLVGQFDYFTELFAASKANDLAYQSFTFRPDGSADFYRVTREAATVFPTSPSGGAFLSLSDDGFAQCSLSNGVQVSLFGLNYASFFVGGNGFVTFGSGDVSYSESLSAHFSKPRVAALFDDLLPGSSTVSWIQMSDKAVITYQDVPEIERASANSFQIELFFNGTIRITYLGLSAADGLAGLSRGEGVPAYFSESDFSAYGPDEDLVVLPSGDFASSGFAGGPFLPSNTVYRVSNTGTNALTWTVAHTAEWVTVSSAGGTLAAGTYTNVSVALNSATTGLAYSVYSGLLTFHDTASGYSPTRNVQLTVLEIPGEISVTDSVSPESDASLPFGKTIVGLSQTESVTVSNLDPVHGLTVSDIHVQAASSSGGIRLPRFTGTIAKKLSPDSCGPAPMRSDPAVVRSAQVAAPSDVPCFGIEMGGQQLVSFRTGDASALTPIADAVGTLIVGVDFLSGDFSRLFALDYDSNDFLSFDTATGAKTVIGVATPLAGHSWTGQAGDPSGVLYACSSDGSVSMLYTVNAETGAATPVGVITQGPLTIDIAINAQGQIYGVDLNGDNLIRIDKSTGEGTVVGSLGIDANYAQGLDFDEENDVLYWAAYSTQAELRVIDTETGNSALVAAFPSFTELNIAVANGGVGCFEVLRAPTLPYRIPPNGSVTFDVACHPASVGSNTASLVIACNDVDEPQISVALSGEGIPDYLDIQPAAGLNGSGHRGGPFVPAGRTYAVSNSSALPITWSSVGLPEWVTVAPASGTLAAGSGTSLLVSFNAAAAALPEGEYNGVLLFSNLTTTLTQAWPLSLEVFTTPEVRVAPAVIVVTNRLGQARQTPLQIGNEPWADAALKFTLSASETARAPVQTLREPVAQDFTRLPKDAEYRAGELLVRFAPAVAGAKRLQALAAAGGGSVVREFKLVPGLAVVKLPEGAAMATALARFNTTVGIVYAQPNYRKKLLRKPNDPLFSTLWGMNNTGQTGGVADRDIDAPEAWESGVGGESVTVAVIDTGVDYTHEDLAANMWVNPGEVPGNGIDDDGNGYVDDIHGYDFYNRDADPMDDHNHGTHCAGTIGAVGDNGVGVAGVCWTVKIMALKFISADDEGYTEDAIGCIEYAVLMGARVLSNSWGGGPYEQALKDAIDAAGMADVLFVAAAGNDYGNDNDDNPSYPASYESDNIISVMSVAASGARSSFSNFGQQSVDLAAPGSSIRSCKRGGGYMLMSGTSMATPHVSGACALLLSLNSTYSQQHVKNALLATTDASLPGQCVAGGLMNLPGAIAVSPAWLRVLPFAGADVAPGAWSNITVTLDAGLLAAGTYAGVIRVGCNDRETPVTNVPVTMVILQDSLSVQPSTPFLSSGYTGGPFSPSNRVFTLTNTGASGLAWTASRGQPWGSVSPASGTLAAGQTAQVTVSLNAQAGLLPPGVFADLLVISNATSTAVHSRGLHLTVLERVLDHLEWAALAPTQFIGEAFAVAITARDGGNGTLTNFTGSVALTGAWGDLLATSILGDKSPAGDADAGTNIYTLGYSFTPSSQMTVTSVRHYFGTKVSIWTDAGVLLASQNASSVPGTWVETSLEAPVQLSAGQRYRVGVCFSGVYYFGMNMADAFSHGMIDGSYQIAGDAFPTQADSERWWFVDLGYTIGTGAPVALTPTLSGIFSNGVWVGSVTVLEGATNMFLTADDGEGHRGVSRVFDTVVRVISIPEAVDSTTLVWTTSAAQGWAGQAVVSHDGVDAARSGAVGNRQSTWMETQVTGPGDASFWWRVSSEADWDWLEFYVDGALVDRITGETGWLQKTATLTAGAHTLRWRYVKDGADIDPVGQDCGWVDAFIGPSQSVLPPDWLMLYGLPNDGSADYADSDGDGMPNWDEWVAGTVPTNGLSLLQMVGGGGPVTNGFHVSWQSVAGKRYWVGSSETLAYPVFFTPFVSNVLGQAGSTDVLDTRPLTTGKRFYRVGVQQE